MEVKIDSSGVFRSLQIPPLSAQESIELGIVATAKLTATAEAAPAAVEARSVSVRASGWGSAVTERARAMD